MFVFEANSVNPNDKITHGTKRHLISSQVRLTETKQKKTEFKGLNAVESVSNLFFFLKLIFVD